MIRADAKAYSTLPGRTASGAWSPSTHKARFILMLTNGVDPYNGSTSIMNQGSPYVDNAIADAQRAGVTVYSIYFGDAGMAGGSVNNSGQDYLNQIAQATESPGANSTRFGAFLALPEFAEVSILAPFLD